MTGNIYDAGTPGFNNGLSNSGGPLARKGLLNAAYVVQDPRVRDTNGRQKMSIHQNIYDADFEYGSQPLRWEQFTYSTASPSTAVILQQPGLGGVQMQISTAGDITIRQSRPYHRYQPGKSMYVSSNVNFGGPIAGQFQRVGIFDDGNGMFVEQSDPTTVNPSGMYVVIRSDSQSPTGGIPVDTRIPYERWNGDPNIKRIIDWTKVQMVWMEYSWYGAGALRWGIILNGEPYILHEYGSGNGTNQNTGAAQVIPWSRTGNLPVRYEQRQGSATTPTVFRHFGVSVLIEGGSDRQRGFTYSYGLPLAAPIFSVAANKTRYPLLSVRMKPMGQVTYTQANGALAASSTTTLVAAAGTFSSGAIAPLTISGNGTIATVTLPNTAAMPAVGSQLTVSGTTPSGFSAGGPFPITAVTNNTISYANTTPGTATVVGTVTYIPNLAGRMVNYQALIGAASPSSMTAVTTPSSVTGTVLPGSSLLNITAVTGTIYPGMTVTFTGGTFAAGTNYITSQVSGTTGGVGVYTITTANTSANSSASAPVIGVASFYTVTAAAAHNLTIADVVTLSSFTSAVNGVYPVLAIPSGTTFVVNLGYGGFTGAVTVGSGVVTANYTARVTSTVSATTLNIVDVVTGLALANPPAATYNYSVGLIDRGQLLPQTLVISSTQPCYVELIASTPTAQVGLQGAVFQAESGLGSLYSFAERDISATAMSGGEVVFAFASPPSGLQTLDLSYFFPILTNIKGNIPDILVVAITTTYPNPGGTAAPVSVNLVCQEAMS